MQELATSPSASLIDVLNASDVMKKRDDGGLEGHRQDFGEMFQEGVLRFGETDPEKLLDGSGDASSDTSSPSIERHADVPRRHEDKAVREDERREAGVAEDKASAREEPEVADKEDDIEVENTPPAEDDNAPAEEDEGESEETNADAGTSGGEEEDEEGTDEKETDERATAPPAGLSIEIPADEVVTETRADEVITAEVAGESRGHGDATAVEAAAPAVTAERANHSGDSVSSSSDTAQLPEPETAAAREADTKPLRGKRPQTKDMVKLDDASVTSDTPEAGDIRKRKDIRAKDIRADSEAQPKFEQTQEKRPAARVAEMDSPAEPEVNPRVAVREFGQIRLQSKNDAQANIPLPQVQRPASVRPAQMVAAANQSESANPTRGKQVIADVSRNPLNAARFVEDIVRQARLLRRPDGSTEIRLKLEPPELGSVLVRLSLRSNRLQAQVQVDTPLVREMLNNAVQRVREALAGEGLDLEQFDIGLRQRPNRHADRRSASRRGAISGLDSDAEGRDIPANPRVSAMAAVSDAGLVDFVV